MRPRAWPRSSIRSATSSSISRSPREHGLRIKHVFLTHFHADFVAGHLELRDRRAPRSIWAPPRRPSTRSRRWATATRRVRSGAPEGARNARPHARSRSRSSCSTSTRSATVPHAVLTGDTLFIGDVGRPDLRVALGWSAADLGAMLYDSLPTKLLTLPDASLVYPAHGAGSLCGKALSKETVSTIGEQRRSTTPCSRWRRRRSSSSSPPTSRMRRRTSPTTRCSTARSARRSTTRWRAS